MMQLFCVLTVGISVVILAYSIRDYYKILRFMQSQAYDRKIFQNRICIVSFGMMALFLVGYVIVCIIFGIQDYHSEYVLIAAIFFLGSLFVLCMVRVQRLMAITIIDKSTQIIQAMISAMEAKDIYTKGHSEHVRNLALLVFDHLPDEQKRQVNRVKLSDAAMLHDIGKISIPDYVLNKPDKLTQDEFEIIKSHPKNGKTIVENTCYQDIGDWILYHHERIDGNGYYHLSGESLPLETRIITLADMFSALYTDRVYRKKSSYDDVIAAVREEAGRALDPALVDIFCSICKTEIDGATVL